jgi:hypothetical protein
VNRQFIVYFTLFVFERSSDHMGDRTVLDTAPFEMSVGFHMGDRTVLDTAPFEMRVGFHMGIELC